MVLFNTVAVGLPGFAYLLIGYLPDEHPMWTVWLFTAILMFFSTAGGGFYKCGTLCSRQAIHGIGGIIGSWVAVNVKSAEFLQAILALRGGQHPIREVPHPVCWARTDVAVRAGRGGEGTMANHFPCFGSNAFFGDSF